MFLGLRSPLGFNSVIYWVSYLVLLGYLKGISESYVEYVN